MRKLLILPCLFLFLFSCDSDDDVNFGLNAEWELIKFEKRGIQDSSIRYVESEGGDILTYCDYEVSLDDNDFCNSTDAINFDGCIEFVDDKNLLKITNNEFNIISIINRNKLIYDRWNGCYFLREDSYTETEKGTSQIDYENQKITVHSNSIRHTNVTISPERFESPNNDNIWDELDIEDKDYSEGEKVIEYEFELTETGELILEFEYIFEDEPYTTYHFRSHYIKK